MLCIQRATLLTPDEQIDDGVLLIDQGRIVAVGDAARIGVPADAEIIDAGGLIVTPGFIDLQLNGAFGEDFTWTPTSIWQVAAGLPRWGVTSFLPTLITSPLQKVAQAQEVLEAGPPSGWRGSIPLGLHCEGPFLNPQKKGAHNPAYLRAPTLEAIADWTPEQHVRLVTLAPELEGGLELVRALAQRGVVVSAGHSMASYEEARAAFAAGVRYGTHLFNAMPPLEHREPGLPGALLNTPEVTVGIIPDGIHVHPAIVALAWAAKGPSRLNVVTDAMAALGMPPGRYQIADHEVFVTEDERGVNVARLASGTLAGSVLSMDEALRRLIRYTGCSLSQALATITSTPAELLGIGHERGRLRAGARADLVFLTPTIEVVRTMIAGVTCYVREESQ
ncbi:MULTISPECIES: N-acetylglucosamine-6-phosphate deacetylase [Caldilinea]|jgi:N-acetylglucosamine-6-phosphate deacetylase|uniref:N-acetylglucosamine-6-phosphate deacetylase n=1 Tax=Caldilinea aerophila (strain DSM 14535 / JCM 11387 / NBRC 104270 / STL-6-O1) TaxID=926550 RepID=I0I8P9_CALAS|nr:MULTISPECIES: N-acetylglucosamine-6-phosphate deacetylase [Caldilinea]MBO9392854.1 N-acetylglucosamine-6-phosphate deacetylase [Caldilinea sp.]BAM01637.1 N-acetylglucosamine-6-phosphate deacetylase [Caldilinea aerophila DSM 14535 = NBRC 104270]GIV72975.1 MAG: N-acetylglucosamine-6-phosphate deacetylase [Caldilinea sp.]